jgi:Ion transport protein
MHVPAQLLTSLCRWDAACCVLVLHVALTLPPQLAFGDAGSFGWLRAIGLAVGLFFLADVYVNVRTGYFSFDKETGIWSLQMEGSNCAWHYACGWAIVDIVSVIPFDLILLIVPGLQGRMHAALARIPRALKLLRLPRLFRLVLSLLRMHWQACVIGNMFLLQKLHGTMRAPATLWRS